MPIPGWSRAETPFHEGELAIHTRMGTREKVEDIGRRFIRDFMPEQHRDFFMKLPYLIVGTVDEAGCPWASILFGNTGFITSPDERVLQIAATPLFGDPLAENLAVGADIGLLGVELPTRRRNRLNGTIAFRESDRFSVQVTQSFGNFPKYIQAREIEWADFDPTAPKPIHQVTNLTETERSLIAAADTFFIATAYQASSAGAASGVDVSHRGGPVGFVRIDGDDTLTVPDFSGNCMFNTFGNLEVNPRAGLLFIDFNSGDLLYLTGTARVVWEGEEIQQFQGAERLLKFSSERGLRVEGGMPFGWSSPEFSPALKSVGSW